jgi:hypothetical protein
MAKRNALEENTLGQSTLNQITEAPQGKAMIMY